MRAGMRHKRALVGAVLTVVLGSAVGAASSDAAGQTPAPPTKVKLGVSGRPDQAALELAFHRGYFTELGLDIETVPATSGNEFVAPLATNQLDVASGAPTAALLNALNRKIDIRIVADFAHIARDDDGAVSIVLRKDLADSGAVRTIADLKGRVIAAGNGRGQVANLVVHVMLTRGNVAPSEVTIRGMNFSDALAALATKNIDAAFLVEPLVTQGQAKDIERIFLKGSDIRPGTELSVLVYSPEFAKKTDTATKFMIGYLRGVRDYHDALFLKKNRDAAIDILTQYLPVKDRKIWEDSMPQHTDLNGQVDGEDIQRQGAIYKELGDIVGDVPDISKFIDRQFANAAVEKLGKR